MPIFNTQPFGFRGTPREDFRQNHKRCRAMAALHHRHVPQ